MNPRDKMVTCRGCGRAFLFMVREEEFYAQQGFASDPGRCPDCRVSRVTRSGGGSRGGHERLVRPPIPSG